ncbi:MAG: hypothetical protein ACK56I_20840, partial [bacterium]
MLGSSDGGLSWTVVDAQSAVTSWNSLGRTFSVSGSLSSFGCFRLVTHANNGDSFLSIAEWILYDFTPSVPSSPSPVPVCMHSYEYPTEVMTGNEAAVNPLVNGGGPVIARASSEVSSNERASAVFDKNTGSWWTPTLENQYSGAYTGTTKTAV